MEVSRLSLLGLLVWASGVCAQVIPRGLGETLTLQCEYAEEYKDHRKTWCRETAPNNCIRIVTTLTTSTTAKSDLDRIQIQDNKQTRVISVTAEKLKEEDTGTYWCGVYFSNRNEVQIIKRIELRVSDGLSAVVIRRSPGETVNVECKYSAQYANLGKTWCRETSGDTCDPLVTIIRTGLIPGAASSGAIRILDDYQRNVISVMVQQLTQKDAGVYWCRVNLADRTEILKRIELRVSQGLFAQVIPRHSGETVTVECTYPVKNKFDSKIWCRERTGDTCNPIANTRWPVSGRTRIQEDYKQVGVISVTVEKLTKEDTGIYWCSVNLPNQAQIIRRIDLQVSDGLQAEVIEKETGETLDVRCEYPESMDYGKTWCRVTGDTYKRIVTTPWEDGTVLKASDGRTMIEDDKLQRLISVTVKNLTEGDSGEYWCGVYIFIESRVQVLKRKILRVSKGGNAEPTYNNQTLSLPGQEGDVSPGTGGLSSHHIIYISVGLGFLLLITLIALFYVVWIQRRRGRMQRLKDSGDTNDKTLSAGPDVSPSAARSEDESSFSEMDNHEVKYATLTHRSGGHGDATYSNVGFARRPAAPNAMVNPENVEYASINLHTSE